MSNKSESHFFPKRGLTSTNPRQNVLGKKKSLHLALLGLCYQLQPTPHFRRFLAPLQTPIFRYELMLTESIRWIGRVAIMDRRMIAVSCFLPFRLKSIVK